MRKPKTVRFATGSPAAPFSGVWRLVAKNDDVFIGTSKAAMGVLKISLHKSGVWVLAATEQSGATFEQGNRRAKQWKRPLQHARGITRGPSILVPHTSLGSRPIPPEEGKKKILWVPAPAAQEMVEFSVYFVEAGSPTRWDPDQTILAECTLASGHCVTLFASTRQSPADFLATVEKMLYDPKNIVRMQDPSAFTGGSFLWFTESPDALRVPMIIDLPVPVGRDLPVVIAQRQPDLSQR